MFRSRVMGGCKVAYWIEPDGTTSDAHIRYCVPAGFFETATLKAISYATYKLETDPALNRRRQHFAQINFRFDGVSDHEGHYLKPGQWIRLRYTLTAEGRTKDVEVVAKSDPSIPSRGALLQLEQTQLAPILENGRGVEKPGQLITITSE